MKLMVWDHYLEVDKIFLPHLGKTLSKLTNPYPRNAVEQHNCLICMEHDRMKLASVLGFRCLISLLGSAISLLAKIGPLCISEYFV